MKSSENTIECIHNLGHYCIQMAGENKMGHLLNNLIMIFFINRQTCLFKSMLHYAYGSQHP